MKWWDRMPWIYFFNDEFQASFFTLLSFFREDPLEEEMATHSSILTWEIPWTEKPGGLQSVGLQLNQHHHQAGTYSLVFELCFVITFGSKQIYFPHFSWASCQEWMNKNLPDSHLLSLKIASAFLFLLYLSFLVLNFLKYVSLFEKLSNSLRNNTVFFCFFNSPK